MPAKPTKSSRRIYPTIKELTKLYDVDKRKAKAFRAIMQGYSPNEALSLLDKLYNTFGVESFSITVENGRKYIITYLNTGDSYKTTILYVKPVTGRRGRYEVGSWGDWAEREKGGN